MRVIFTRLLRTFGAFGLGFALCLGGVAAPALAQVQPAPERYNTVELQAEAQREVTNDLLNASLYVEATDANAAQLANTLNRATNEALKIAANFKSVRVRSGGNNTYPVYDRSQKLTGWRGRAEIRLDSRDFQAAAGLIAKLQSGMQLGSISFSLAQDTREKLENDLIAEAISAFRARADIARQALTGKAYKIRRIAINTGGGMVQPRPMMRLAASASADVTTPQLEGGLSTVTVSVSGAVEVE